jgi:hypothetical protein
MMRRCPAPHYRRRGHSDSSTAEASSHRGTASRRSARSKPLKQTEGAPRGRAPVADHSTYRTANSPMGHWLRRPPSSIQRRAGIRRLSARWDRPWAGEVGSRVPKMFWWMISPPLPESATVSSRRNHKPRRGSDGSAPCDAHGCRFSTAVTPPLRPPLVERLLFILALDLERVSSCYPPRARPTRDPR